MEQILASVYAENSLTKLAYTMEKDMVLASMFIGSLGVSEQLFIMWTWVLNHGKYIEIKQNRNQTKSYFDCYFVNQVSCLSIRDVPFTRKSHCSHNKVCFLSIIIRILLNLIISNVHKDLWSSRMKTETESTNWEQIYLHHELIIEVTFLIWNLVYRSINQRPVWFKFCN